MRQFDFATNIEERSPFTGNVYMVNRMTSEYAEKHPLNVGQFIEDVYQQFAGTEFEESRETLRKVWMATLSMPVRGDKSVYPKINGAHRPAAIKVWLLAGDYWRRGFRMGDVLPERCPSVKITRLEDGWIALFPKDMHLLDDRHEIREPKEKSKDSEPMEMTLDFDEAQTEESTLPKIDDKDDFDNSNLQLNLNLNAMEGADADDADVSAESVFAVRETEEAVVETEESVLVDVEHAGDSPSCDIEDITEGTVPVCSSRGGGITEGTVPVCSSTPTPSQRERKAECRRRRREQREAQRRSYEERLEREAREAEELARQQERSKIFAAVGAAAVTLVMIYFFGLLGPAVFGLLAGGLLKG